MAVIELLIGRNPGINSLYFCGPHFQPAGKWLKRNGESIYGADAHRSLYYDKTLTTRKGDKVYLHLFGSASDGISGENAL